MSQEPWSNAPLIQVTALVQFDAVLNLPKRYGDLQDRLRTHNFIGSESFEQTFFVQEFSKEGMRFGQQNQIFWNYFDPLEHKVFTVSEQQFAYASSTYTSFGDFLTELKIGLDALIATIDGDVLVRQIALRYTDWMQGTTEMPLREQLNPSLLGFSTEETQGTEVISISNNNSSQMLFRASSGSLALNALNSFVGRKPSITRLKVEREVLSINEFEKDLVLDINVSQSNFSELGSGERLLLSQIPEKLKQFHSIASEAFQKALTERGLVHYRGY
jgi:uncharacterized protein (TIGR04255 family)